MDLKETKIDREVEVQKRTFGRWMNYHLTKREIKVNDLFVDLLDGLVLINLMEVLTGRPSPRKFHPKPVKMHIHQLENIDIALKFVSMQAIKLVNIGPADIHQGRPKPILGLIWSLINRYSSGGSSDSLLDWVNNQIKPYTQVDLATNFTTSWQDGKILSALVDSLQKGGINMDNLNPNAEGCIKNAMGVAEASFGIPQLVDAADMANAPDEKSNITYISLFKQYVENEKKKRDEAKKLAKVDPATSYAQGPGLVSAISGDTQPATFTVYSLNEKGEPAIGKLIRVQITDAEGKVVLADVKNNEDGTYSVSYKPTAPGEHTITVFLEGTAIKDMPVKVGVKEGAEAKLTTSVQFVLTLNSRLPSGEEKKEGGDRWEVHLSDGKEQKKLTTVADKGNGKYTVNYVIPATGPQLTLIGELNGAHIAVSPLLHAHA
jgi:filamin